MRLRRGLALRRGRQGPQGVRLHRLGARQGREAVLAARRRGRRPGVGSLQADVRQVLGAVPAQVPIQYSPPPESPHRITTRVVIQTHVREGRGLPKHKFTELTRRRRRRGGPACRAAVQARDGKKSEPAPTMYARFPVLSPRHLTRGDTLLYSRRGRYRRLPCKKTPRTNYGATFVCGCSGPG